VHRITSEILQIQWIAETFVSEVLINVPSHYHSCSAQYRAVILFARLPFGLHSSYDTFPEPATDCIWEFVLEDIIDHIALELASRLSS
jgi:hypothetical protein